MQIYTNNAASADTLSSILGTGALDKINAEFKKQGLFPSTGVAVEVVAPRRVDNTGVIVGI